MASYAKAQALNRSQPSIIAQAKPAIISSPTNPVHQQQNFNNTTGVLSEKINSALQFSSRALEREFSRINFDQNVKHIEDDSVIQRQNASNQMRQAAVMAAVASQQKVRLSATERLALTAKRPVTNQQLHSSKQLEQSAHNNSVTNSKPTPLPTLETLLAAQRQLQQHTKQRLNSVPQQLVNNYENSSSNKQATNQPVTTTATAAITQQRNKPLPPSPPRSPSPQFMKQALASAQANYGSGADTYDKDLPPLPPSISPSTSTDDSQLNSLESHQSSPATSLVSLPPPPPPISSYLEQYDEVNNCLQSNSSSPSLASTVSEISSVKQFLPPPVHAKPTPSSTLSLNLKPSTHPTGFDLPLPSLNQSKSKYESQDAPKPSINLTHTTQNCIPPVAAQMKQQGGYDTDVISNKLDSYGYNSVPQQTNPINTKLESPRTLHPKSYGIPSNFKQQPPVHQDHEQKGPTLHYELSSYNSQIDYQQHVFKIKESSSPAAFMPPPPPPLPEVSSGGGFDEPDNGGFRFPTPPPPDLLEDDDDDVDDGFECKIPTPPPFKSIPPTSFPSNLYYNPQAQQQHQQPQKQFTSSSFDSSIFSASATSGTLQPPPLFCQQKQQQQQQHLQQSTPQLTVHINNEDGGLLSKAKSNANHHHHHRQVANHHHMMMSMAASSSSPSSSSDGDGQSSNSSSSTSGIHSSIDSPSSSNSKLDDLNYGRNEAPARISKKPSSSLSHHESVYKNLSNPMSQTGAVVGAAKTKRPALKQKKTVSFSDKVELVACADEQSEDHLPNPLLARVLAGKLQ